jgi:hypothetical protein
MTESFLHFLWKYRLYSKELYISTGESLVVSHPGQYNSDSGPDFFDARISIGNTRWAGNVEIHLRSSLWVSHGHNHNKAYDGIILHVVYNDDLPLKDVNGKLVPCLELRHFIDARLFLQYETMLASKNWIPCASLFNDVPAITLTSWLERLVVSRLEKKVKAIENLFDYNTRNLEETFYQWMARSFGFKTNAQPFEMLARSLPHRLLMRHGFNPLQIEALIFGQSGMLNEKHKDEYPCRLQSEYLFLKQKYNLISLDPHIWKFMRLRPVNFPCIRLAQWAALLSRTQLLLSTFINTEKVENLIVLLNVEPDSYWIDHYRFGKLSEHRLKPLGLRSAELIVINTLIPFLFFYGRQSGEQSFNDKSLSLLLQLPPENNSIIKKWSELGYKATNASDSQALLELKNSYCRLKNCLNCAIGVSVIR